MTPRTPRPPHPGTLRAAILLAATGGLLDAVVYLLHGNVFANAMTGNVIFLGISLMGRNGAQALRHLAPIAAFLFGVACSRILRLRPQRQAALFVLALELLTLAVAGLLPLSFPQMLFTAIIAFVSALQVSTFRQIGRFTYNSTFVTGNLRELSDSFLDSRLQSDPALRRHSFAKARKLAFVCLAFLAGAMAGAWGAPRFADHTLWFALPLLLAVALSTAISMKPAPQKPDHREPAPHPVPKEPVRQK